MPDEKPIMRPEDVASYQAARHALDAGKKLACFDELLAACEAALELPTICEEIGYAGNHTCLQDGHAIIKTKNGEYVALHTQGGYPARDRILASLRTAIARAKEVK